jgi:hypothetical protein
MAYSVGTPSSDSQAGSATSISTPGTISVSSGDSIVVFAMAAQDQTASFYASDGTNTYTLRQAIYPGSPDLSFGVLVAENCTAGTYTVTAGWSGTRATNGVFAVGISGLKSASYQTGAAITVASPGTGSDGITTGNMTPTEQPACVIGLAVTTGALATPAAGTGFTSVGTGWQFGSGTDLARLAHKQITSTADVPFTATAGSNARSWAASVILSESTGLSFVPRGTLLGVG